MGKMCAMTISERKWNLTVVFLNIVNTKKQIILILEKKKFPLKIPFYKEDSVKSAFKSQIVLSRGKNTAPTWRWWYHFPRLHFFLNCTAPKSHPIALPWLVHACSSGTLSGGGALIQFCQQKNSHSKAHNWLSDHHVSIWPTESSQVKPSTSVPVLNRKSLLVTSMTTAILWHYKQHPRDTRMELQKNNTRLIFYSIKSGWSAWIKELLCFFSKLWNELFFNAPLLECQ